MKKFAFFTIMAVLFGLATPGYPAHWLTLGWMDGITYEREDYVAAGKNIQIEWQSSGVDLQTKVKLVLLKNDAPYRVIATGLPLTNGFQTAGRWYGYGNWTPATGDIGCNYKLQISAEGDNTIPPDTTRSFNISPVDHFTPGDDTWVKLDAPHAMEQLLRGHSYLIRWTCIPAYKRWPTGNLKLELFDNNNKVADIATVNVNFQGGQCPIHGSHNWVVGNNLPPGNTYRIKISGDSNWMGDNFLIVIGPGYKPGSGTKPKLIDKNKESIK